MRIAQTCNTLEKCLWSKIIWKFIAFLVDDVIFKQYICLSWIFSTLCKVLIFNFSVNLLVLTGLQSVQHKVGIKIDSYSHYSGSYIVKTDTMSYWDYSYPFLSLLIQTTSLAEKWLLALLLIFCFNNDCLSKNVCGWRVMNRSEKYWMTCFFLLFLFVVLLR